MKRTILVSLLLLLVVTLSGCNSDSKKIDKYYDNHLETMSDYDFVETKTSVNFVISESTTTLDSYMYTDNENTRVCAAAEENDPSGFDEYTVNCLALFNHYTGGVDGVVPYPLTDDEKYPLHTVYTEFILEEKILGYLTDEDQVLDDSEDDNVITFRKTINFNDFDKEMQDIISSGLAISFPEVPVLISAIYDTDLKMFTEFIIDNSDVMILAYRENFGSEIGLTNYYITVTSQAYTERFNYFYPEEFMRDDHVNYFDDGDYYGYYTLEVDDVIEGELEYKGDQDIIKIVVPVGGVYNLSYNSNDYQKSMLFGFYSERFEFMYEGVIEEEGMELQDHYLDPGVYYVILFTHNTADGYELIYEKVQ